MSVHLSLEYLGTRRAVRGKPGALAVYQVYVVWLPATASMLESLMELHRGFGLPCPECGTPWPLAREHGMLAKLMQSPEAGSISDSCPTCPTILHCDRTAPADQPLLNWPRLYEHDPLAMGDRPQRVGSRFVRVA